MKKLIFDLILLALWVGTTVAQNTGYMETISIPDGLSNPNVQNVYQDRFGYIWIMTEDGLNRFDGSDIKIYRNDPDNPASLSNNSVYSAVEDTSGYLWIGSHAVVIRYDYATESFLEFPVAAMADNQRYNMIISLYTDSKGRVWAGSSIGSAHRLNPDSKIFDFISSVDNEGFRGVSAVWNITELKNGKLLYADFQRGIYQYDESSGTFFKFLLGEDYSPLQIFRIQEDDDGLIWFLGKDKVVRYNPNFYSYQVLDEVQIQNPLYHIGYHKVSAEDYIIVSDPFGLIHYNPKTSKITEKTRTSIPPYSFTSDKYGVMWLGGQGGLIKYDPNREPFRSTQISINENQDNRGGIINYLNLDLLNRQFIWLLSSDNKFIKHDLSNSNNSKYDIPLERPVNRFIQDREGNFILGSTFRSGLLKYDFRTNEISTLNEINAASNFQFRTRDLAFDQSNNLFVASLSGMIYYNFTNKHQFVLPTVTNRMYNTESTGAIQIAMAEADEMALITKADESNEYSIDFSIKEDTPVLIHCMGEGTIDGIGDQMYDYGLLKNSRDQTIYAMQDFSKTYHAGGGQKNRRQYEVLMLQKGDYNLKYIMDVGHSYATFNTIMPADSANYGIQVYKITDTAYMNVKNALAEDLDVPTVALGIVNNIEVSRKFSNSIYISSATQGLFRYNILDSTFKQYSFGELKSSNQKNFVQSCYEDNTGNLWISSGQGLVMLNPDNGKWRVFTEKDGLPSNNLLKTIEDNSGDLWILSLGGLSKFNKSDPADQWGFVNYDTRDGLTGYSFNGDLIKTPLGEILFVVGDALHRFTPGKSNPVKPDVVIEDLKISDVSVFNSESTFRLTKSLMETKEIELAHGMNDLSFTFKVIHYSRPYKNRMFYKMEGFNKDWIESDLGTATFTNLDPGNYEFKVRGISADGIRNDSGAAIKIEIAPPWWRTTLAYIGYFVMLAGLVFTFDRIQRRRILNRERSATAIREAELRAQLAESENERKTKELEEARQLQLSMLPKELPQLPNLDIAVYMQTATEVGGDYYDFHVGLDGTLTVVIGDATGHGMKAGTMVTTAKSLFNSYAPNPDIVFSFQEITRCIRQMNFSQLSMCLTMVKIQGNKLKMSTAGMPPSFIFRRDTRVVEEHLFQAMPLGTMEKFPYEIKDTTLNPGDTILLISDGLPELENQAGEMYGYKKIRNRFEEVADQTPGDIISYFKNEGASWVNNEDPDDDVTFVVIKVK